MRFEIVQRFASSIEDVEAAFIDPGFIEALGALPKLGKPKLVDQLDDPPLFHQRVAYRFTGDVSSAVRRVIDPSRLTWTEESTLDRRTHVTTWHIVPDHYGGMLKCSATSTLVSGDDGASTTRTTVGDIKVGVPLVGGKVERAILSGLEEHAQMEVDLLDGWVRSHR